MIVDLISPVVFPLYFINRRGHLFYSHRHGAYYIRLDSPDDWKCVYTDCVSRIISSLDPGTFDKAPEEIWKEIKLDDLEGVYKPTSEGDYMSRSFPEVFQKFRIADFRISDETAREVLLNGLTPGVPAKRRN